MGITLQDKTKKRARQISSILLAVLVSYFFGGEFPILKTGNAGVGQTQEQERVQRYYIQIIVEGVQVIVLGYDNYHKAQADYKLILNGPDNDQGYVELQDSHNYLFHGKYRDKIVFISLPVLR